MATTRIKDKISQLVRSQFPEFIQSDYNTLITFVEAYYKFLEQDQGAHELIQNSRSYSDIDLTTDAFVKYFLKNYAPDIPQSVVANKKLIIKKVKDLYEAKGSELSFDLLFRFLFNSTVEVNYPFDFVLRASDGRWNQKVSLRLQTTTGNRNSITNRLLRYTSSNGFIYETPILETRNLTSTITEVFLDANKIAPNYALGDTVVVPSSSGSVFTGTILPTTNGYTVTTAGTGFKVGQVYTVNYEGGVSSLFQITAVTSTGGISEIKFIGFGYGFPTDIGTTFTAVFDPGKNVSEISEGISSRTQGFGSSGSVLLDDSSSPDRYFDSNYVEPFYTFTSEAATFNNSTYSAASVGSSTPPSNYAVITMRLGSLSRYPGLYTAPNGFLSEPDVRLEDALLYQPFAYQTTTDLDVSSFYDIVRNLIHPAGQRLFNNRTISASINLSANLVISPRSNVFTELLDVFDILDAETYNLTKNLDDAAIISEDANLNIQTTFEDSILDISDLTTLSINLADIDDSVETTSNLSINFNLITSDQLNIVENSSLELQLNFTEQIDISDKPIVFPSLTSTTDINEEVSFNLQTGLPSDTVVMTDDITVGYFVTRTFIEQRSNDYFLEFYADDYAVVTGFIVTDTQSISTDPGITDSTESVSDVFTIQTQLPTIIDSLAPSDVTTVSSNVLLSDTQTISEEISIQLLVNINNQTTTSDLISGLNPNYAESGYFANIYAGETII